MTALPLIWGEGDASDILQNRSARSDTLVWLDRNFDINPVDIISMGALGRDVLVLAQPRRLVPGELVALDKWLRRGGQVMIFADPELLGSSRLAVGDNRRAPPVTLLDPLFRHWGIALGDSDNRVRTMLIESSNVAMAGSGTWQFGSNCSAITPEVIDCRIGKGRAMLIGDADMLDARLWREQKADNVAWIASQLTKLASRR